ncbi:MAG: hypothetical protein CL666_14535 [Balneola sp.]|nr:hypothetical protein [Balneola sp.]|tara:strand:+ start:50511 stop:50828 length:318 start_codon:yes stop_codon:yes gene_type:complete
METTVKAPEKVSRRIKFVRFREINTETMEESFAELPEVDGILKCPVSKAKKWCSCSPRHIRNLMDKGILTKYNADLSIRKKGSAGSAPVFFDLYEFYDPKKTINQ